MVRLLEYHADLAPDLDRIDAGRVDVLPLYPHAARHARPGHHLVHPVEAADERRFAAAGRADERGHRLWGHRDADVVQHVVVAEPRVQILDEDAVGHVTSPP